MSGSPSSVPGGDELAEPRIRDFEPVQTESTYRGGTGCALFSDERSADHHRAHAAAHRLARGAAHGSVPTAWGQGAGAIGAVRSIIGARRERPLPVRRTGLHTVVHTSW